MIRSREDVATRARDAREMRGVRRRKDAMLARLGFAVQRSIRARGRDARARAMRWGIRRTRGDTDGLFTFLFARAV